MEGFNIVNLINKNYEVVLDIIAKPLKNKKEVKKNRDKVYKLTFGFFNFSDELSSKVLDGFNFLWDVMPKEVFDVYSIDKLNQRIQQFSEYVVSIEKDYEDHGFGILVAYYLTVCDKYLIISEN